MTQQTPAMQARSDALKAAADATAAGTDPAFDDKPEGYYLNATTEELDAALNRAGLYRTARSL